LHDQATGDGLAPGVLMLGFFVPVAEETERFSI